LFEADLRLDFVSPSTDPDDTSVNDDLDTSEVTTCNGGDPNTSEPPIDDIDESIHWWQWRKIGREMGMWAICVEDLLL